MAVAEVPVPPQWKEPALYDLRGATMGPRGFKAKRKRDMDDLEEQAQQTPAPMEAAEAAPAARPLKRVKLNTVGLGKASGRPWKEPGQKASSLRNPKLATSWDQKMQAKRERQQFQEHRKAAVAARKDSKRAARTQKEEAKKRREENQAKSAVTQKISSHATLRKMMKSRKQKKLLQKADTVD